MTGSLDGCGEGDAPDHTELLIDFEDGSHLVYVDPREFGAIAWVDDVDWFVEDQGLGPDPLADEVDFEIFSEQVGSRRGSIKSTLINQEVVAGLGNDYVDEILFQCGIHPESPADALGVERLPDDWLLPHRQPGERCPRDGETIERPEVAGRSTYLCPSHQTQIGR